MTLALVAVALTLSSCGASSTLRWRDVRITLPDGWVVHERADTRLAITDAPLGEPDAIGPGLVGAFFTYEPGATAERWRELGRDEGWVLEEDRTLDLDGLVAQQLVFDQSGSDVPTREMVVVIPSRGIVVLFQPAPFAGATDGPDRFLRFRGQFEAILDRLEFGAPPGAMAVTVTTRNLRVGGASGG